MISDIKFITLYNGPKLLMVDGHTFAQKTPKHWYCSKKLSMKCAAKVYLEKEGENVRVIHCDNTHNHLPPRCRRMNGGFYIRE